MYVEQYELPKGWTWETHKKARQKLGVSDGMALVGRAPGVLAWGRVTARWCSYCNQHAAIGHRLGSPICRHCDSE